MTASTPSTPLHVERIGPSDNVERNERGAEVRIGGFDTPPGAFAPGELLALAAHVGITPMKDDDHTRYESISAEILADLATLDPDKREALVERAERAVERFCTISHTLAHGARTEVQFRDDAASAEQD